MKKYIENSIIENAIFYFLKTFFNLLYPIFTFVYASRVLGVEGIGRINFTKNFIMYFVMIAMLGMNYYGVREAAQLREDKEKLKEFVSEVFLINLFSSILAYILLAICMCFLHQLQDYRVLLVINSISIVLSGMGMEWLYQALEKYQYIALRSILFQIIALCLVPILVKDTDDINLYALIGVFATSGFYILNFFYAKKYICVFNYKIRNLKRHMKPILLLFAMAVSIELYTVLDSTMLGFLKGDISVGYYTAAIKINKIMNTLITSLGVVIIPRLSYYLGKQEKEKAYGLAINVYQTVFMLSIPAFVGLFVLSKDILYLFCGKEYIIAADTMQILTPIVLIIPFSIITNLQIFVPLKKEKKILMSTCTGAVINIICNVILIPHFAENGAAIATVLAEMGVSMVCLFNVRKIVIIRDLLKGYYQYWVASIPTLIIGKMTDMYISDPIIRIVMTVSGTIVCYFAILYFYKNIPFFNLLSMLKRKYYKMKLIMNKKV